MKTIELIMLVLLMPLYLIYIFLLKDNEEEIF